MAVGIVDTSGVVAPLEAALDKVKRRPRTIPVQAFVVGCVLNGIEKGHVPQVIEVARTLNSLTDQQRSQLSVTSWDPDQTYDRVDRLFNRIADLLSSREVIVHAGGPLRLDIHWFTDALLRASVPRHYRRSKSVAIDATDIETWGAFQGDVATVELDGAVQPPDGYSPVPRKPGRRKAKILGYGLDGRKQYTPDRDARAGHRSAVQSHAAGPFIGYHLHLVAQTRDASTRSLTAIELGEEVPQVVLGMVLAPAGDTAIDQLVRLVLDRAPDDQIADVIWDRGYSQLSPKDWYFPFQRAGVQSTFMLKSTQQGVRPTSADALLIDGHLFSKHLPPHLHELRLPSFGATPDEKANAERQYNERATWAYSRHQRPDKNGYTRWRCPFAAGRLRSRTFPRTMRSTRSAPLVQVAAGSDCCPQTLTASPNDVLLNQPFPHGTSAWSKSYSRRQAVESVNAALKGKGQFVNLQRGGVRVFGSVKVAIMVAFSLVGYNLDRVRSFEAKLSAAVVRQRAKRRRGGWESILGAPTARPDFPAQDP